MDSRKFKNKMQVNRRNKEADKHKAEKVLIKQEIKSYMSQNVERKWNNYTVVTTLSTTTQFHNFSADISQGDAVNQRSGNVIHMVSLSLKMDMTCGDTTNLIRFVLFKWHPNTTSDTPSALEVLQDNSTPTNICLGPLRITVPKRFRTLYDTTFTLDQVKNFHLIRTVNVKLNWNCSYDTGLNTGSEQLYAMYVSDSTIAPNPAFNWSAAFIYTDS
jgi:hypothetical protein